MNKILKIIRDNYIVFCIYSLIGWLYEVSWFLIVKQEFVNRGFLTGPFLPIYGFGCLILIYSLKGIMEKKHPLNGSWTFICLVFILTFLFLLVIEYTTPRIYNYLVFFSKYGIYLSIYLLVLTPTLYLLIKKYAKEKLSNLDITPIIIFISIFFLTTFIEYIAHYILDNFFNITLWNYSKDFLNINKRVCLDASRNFAIGGVIALYLIQPMIDKLLKKIPNYAKNLITLFLGLPMLIDLIISIKK